MRPTLDILGVELIASILAEAKRILAEDGMEIRGLSTVHTNDAPGTVTRLIDMGIEPFLISSAVILILAQRLIRKTCMECREPIKVHPQLLIDLGVSPDEVKTFPVYKGKGCSICNGTGYKGRVGLYEVMAIKEEIKELILSRASTSEVKKEAMRLG